MSEIRPGGDDGEDKRTLRPEEERGELRGVDLNELRAIIIAQQELRLERIRLAWPERKQQAQEINGNSDFDIDGWLEEIHSKTNAITVEIGHGYRPWIKGRELPLNQVYIGVEAEINPFFVKHPLVNEIDADEAIRKIRETRRDEKIFFIRSNTGFDHKRDDTGLYTDYNPESYLPSEIADQVLVTNVFDDSRLRNYGRRDKLFKELARLVKPGGKIIIHEDSLVTFSKEKIEEFGLQARFVAFAELNPSEFKQLSEYYKLLGHRFQQRTAAEYILVVEKPVNV